MRNYIWIVCLFLPAAAFGQTCEQRFEKVISALNNFSNCSQEQSLQKIVDTDLQYAANNCPQYFAQNQNKLKAATEKFSQTINRLRCGEAKTAPTTQPANQSSSSCTLPPAQSTTVLPREPIKNTLKENPNSYYTQEVKNNIAKEISLNGNLSMDNILDEFEGKPDRKEEESETEIEKRKKTECESKGLNGVGPSGDENVLDQYGKLGVTLNWKIEHKENVYDERSKVCYEKYRFSGEYINANPDKNIEKIEIALRVPNGAFRMGEKDFGSGLGLKNYVRYDATQPLMKDEEFYVVSGQRFNVSFSRSFTNDSKSTCFSYPKPIEKGKYSFNIPNNFGLEITFYLESVDNQYDPFAKGNYAYYMYAVVQNNNNYPIRFKGPDIKITGWDSNATGGDESMDITFVGWLPSNFEKDGTYIEPGKYIKTPERLTSQLGYFPYKAPKIKNVNWNYGFVKRSGE